MERNFFRRVEVAFPVRREAHRERILRDLETYLRDDAQAWSLGRDGRYVRAGGGHSVAQSGLLERYAAGAISL